MSNTKTDEEILKEDPDLAAMFTDDEDDSLNNDEVSINAKYSQKAIPFYIFRSKNCLAFWFICHLFVKIHRRTMTKIIFKISKALTSREQTLKDKRRIGK